MEHTKGGAGSGKDVSVLRVDEADGETVDTEVLAETAGDMHLVLQPSLVLLVALVLLVVLLVEPDLGHGDHLLLLVERDGVELVADQVDLSFIGPLQAHEEALLAQHATGWVVWLQEKNSFGLGAIHHCLLVGFFQGIEGWLEVVFGCGLSGANKHFGLDVEVGEERRVTWTWHNDSVAFIAEEGNKCLN